MQHSSENIVQGVNNMSGYSRMNVSKYVVAAMCGCWWRESTVNPAIWESLIPCAWNYEYEYTHRGGYGLGQWTNVGTSNGRLNKLHTWVTNNGYADGDGYGQLEYILVEGYWTNSAYSRLGYTNLTQFLTSSSTNLNDLVWDFLANWEGVAGNAYSQRLAWARQCLEYIELHQNDGNSYSWVAGNRYLSTAQTLNNVMVIYNYITDGSISGTYHIYCSATGNGSCYAIPSAHDGLAGETFTIYAIPNDGDSLTDLIARDQHGYSVAITVAEEHTYDASLFPYNLWVEATFTGETPPPPPPPEVEVRKKMPIWMYPIFRI